MEKKYLMRFSYGCLRSLLSASRISLSDTDRSAPFAAGPPNVLADAAGTMGANLHGERLRPADTFLIPSLNRRSLLGVTAAFFPGLACAQDLATSYVRLWATRRISVEVPRSWALLDGNQRIDMSAASEALLRRTMPNEPVDRSDVPLARISHTI